MRGNDDKQVNDCICEQWRPQTHSQTVMMQKYIAGSVCKSSVLLVNINNGETNVTNFEAAIQKCKQSIDITNLLV